MSIASATARKKRVSVSRDGQREQQREEDQRHHRPARRGTDRIGGKQRREPRGERLLLSLRHRTGGQVVHRVRRQYGEQGQAERHDHEGHADQQQQEDQQCSTADAPHRANVRRRGYCDDEQRHHQRDDRHPNGVDPQRAERRDEIRCAFERLIVRSGDGQSEDDGQRQGDQNAFALAHRYIIRSPPLISKDAPVM